MSFKTFDLAHDVASLVSPINEVVSIAGTVYAPKWFNAGTDSNVKFFTNIATGTSLTPLGGYWQTVYDSAPTSIQSTALFDITFGYSTGSTYFGNVVSLTASVDEKTKVYREMASVLLGDQNQVFSVNSTPAKECFFVMIKRGLMKDELKKSSISLNLTGAGVGLTGSDIGAASNFKQTVGGDYAPLYTSSSLNGVKEVGQVYYNAGVVVLDAASPYTAWTLTGSYSSNPLTSFSGALNGVDGPTGIATPLKDMIASSSIDKLVDGLRGHMSAMAFHNQTNLYSTIYFCRATNTEFNYSSNPTYIDDSQRIRVTSGSNVLQSRTYITTVGLYDANDNLLAVGKLNKPITKTPDTEAIFRIRLDY